MKNIYWYLPACALMAIAGCGKSEVATQPSAGTTTQPVVATENPVQANTPVGDDRDSFKPSDIVNAPAKELPVTPDSKPEIVVQEFLNALKSGNDGVTAGLLTPVARTETAKHNLAVQPPGTPTAQYQITAAEIDMQDPTLSQVACLWTETDDQGGKRNDEVIWVLKKEVEGWRVCGMAMRVPTRAEPVLFNFEDPPGMMQLSEEVAQEMEKLAQTPPAPEQVGASQPAALEAKKQPSANGSRN